MEKWIWAPSLLMIFILIILYREYNFLLRERDPSFFRISRTKRRKQIRKILPLFVKLDQKWNKRISSRNIDLNPDGPNGYYTSLEWFYIKKICWKRGYSFDAFRHALIEHNSFEHNNKINN
jgi:hypothetical protein